MNTSLHTLLTAMTPVALRRYRSDRQWALAAGLPPETLSRLRKRDTCDFRTLEALASAASLKFVPSSALNETGDLGREDEEQLLDLCASGNVDPEVWRTYGGTFFLAGVAMMLASARDFDRRKYLQLAEELHPGASWPEVFDLWLKRTRLSPSRFLPLVRHRKRVATAPEGVA